MILHIFKKVLCVVFVVSTGNHLAHSAPLSLPSTPYRYAVLDQELAAALQEFGNNLKIKISISGEVKGRIRGRMPDLPPRAFLDRLTDLYNLQWYFDGVELYVSSANEAQTRLLVLTPIRFDALKAALDALNISDERYVVRPAPGNALVMVSGPPRFVALVEQTFNGLVAQAQAQPQAAAVEKPPQESVLLLFRGSSATVIRDGRQEGPYSSLPRQDDIVREPEPAQK
ncbi:type III secretion protein [Mesorhizobium sp. YC-39]|uniref:secretin N-terminal domain-containing protein n=1 Tax=unclassified Mesorhizobium TaxID=325217 RepID=UPI0021E7B5CC|nr:MULTISPECIES: secretin N-terminal domain-containing protein [unclassified Mesorhizobium]MCV3211078.1 type III secretion protein [Mesorhizobium sp. YC-2]MCV3232803.1 type III secretion protein [Mesorhizobium sp. YC-39]